MNYAPHILTAKVNLTGIPKGTRLVYVSDANDYLTYQHGSEVVVLSLADATDGGSFEMREATGVQPQPVTEPLLARVFAANRRLCIAIGIIAFLTVVIDVSGALGAKHVTGAFTVGAVIDLAYFLGLSILVRAKQQLEKGPAIGLTIGLAVLLLFICTALAGEAVHFGILETLCIFTAYKIMRLPNS